MIIGSWREFGRGKRKTRDEMAAEESAGVAVFVSVTVSIFLALISLSNSCAEQKLCMDAKTCVVLDTETCSFQNSVTPAGYRLFNTSSEISSLADLERGVCAPGERQNLIDDSMLCLRQRVFPSALNTEIMDPAASTDHDRACGRWIHAATGVQSTLWAFFDEADMEADVAFALNSRLKIRGGVNSPSKFRAACTRMIVSKSEGAAGTLAYNYLQSQLPEIIDPGTALRAVGALTSHYCDTPVKLGLTFSTPRVVGLAINATDGLAMTTAQLDEWLYAADVDHATRAEASEFVEFMAAATPQTVTMTEVFHVYRGATFGTVAEATTVSPFLYKGDELPTLSRFVQAHLALGNQKARSFLLGAAARCAFAVRSVVTGEFGATSLRSRRAADAFTSDAAALGRLHSQRAEADRLSEVTPEVALNASTVTWSRLRRVQPLTGYTRDHAVSACNAALGAAFPDDVDQAAFDLLVSDSLYTRLGALVSEIRPVVATVLSGPIIGPTLADAATASSIASSSIVRVAGAPAGTWGGKDATIPVAPAVQFTNEDGALVMLLKQARNLFTNRMALVHNGRNGVCDLPPVFSSMSRNAYFLPAHGCSVFLPGILVAPFASELYDDASLQARIGWVIAHEIAHATAVVSWNTAAMDALLVGYQRSTQAEAIADLAAAAAIIERYPSIGNETFCQHVSQIWCARKPRSIVRLFYLLDAGSHPLPNQRGDLLCTFLRRHFS